MATVTADYQDRRRIVFNARGREYVNVREASHDGTGPVGYSSTELLLIALGNCSLGALLNHELLANSPVTRAFATLDAWMVPNPTRVDQILVHVELDVDDSAILEQFEALEVASCACPICNTLAGKVTTTLTLATPAGTR